MGLLGIERGRTRSALDALDAAARGVLGAHHNGRREHRAGRKAVQAGELLVGLFAFGAEVADLRMLAQGLQGQRAVGAAIKEPQTGVGFRAW